MTKYHYHLDPIAEKEYEVAEWEDDEPLECDGCGNMIKKGDLFSDETDNYCLEC